MFTFQEHRELISKLREKNPEFNRLFERYRQLGDEIKRLEAEWEGYSPPELVNMKLDKLEIKRILQEKLKNKYDTDAAICDGVLTPEMVRIAKKTKGFQSKLTVEQQNELRRLFNSEGYTVRNLAALFSVSQTTAYRIISCKNPAANTPLPGKRTVTE